MDHETMRSLIGTILLWAMAIAAAAWLIWKNRELIREICLDASLSAKAMYLKRGYRETAYHTLRTKENAFLCYDSMAKQLPHNPA